MDDQNSSLSAVGRMTIGDLLAGYATGTPVEAVVRRVYAAIEEADDPGIFITLRQMEDVLKAAAHLPAFDPAAYPLWGIPFAVKDNIDVAGIPTTCACPAFAYMPERNATAVERLTSAGALVIGKTNLDQFATGLVGVRTPYPVPRNAIDPTLVPGGSSSGSAVAVARGLVSFALGTDTAGSGRIPAGLNNIVGLKPSVGAVPSTGMVPACRLLDCISVFAATVDDSWLVYTTMAGLDVADTMSRSIKLGSLSTSPPHLTLGVPSAKDLKFFGDDHAEAAFRKSIEQLVKLGASFCEIDMTPFYETAALLYEGAWVAERHAALRNFMKTDADAVYPVTRGIVERASNFSATDLFDAIYRLAALKRATEPIWSTIDALIVPTSPHAPTLADLAADPVLPNAQLGTYTNFVNLLDLAAIAVPGPWRDDRRPAGITIVGPRGSDSMLATLGRVFHASIGGTIGATGQSLPTSMSLPQSTPMDLIEIAVVGAHLSGLELNSELREAGATFRRAALTEPKYRLYALPGGPPYRPGLVRVGSGGVAIETEVWALPESAFGRFVSRISAPLGIGTVFLSDGTRPQAFLCEAVATADAEDISAFGGWRAYVTSQRR